MRSVKILLILLLLALGLGAQPPPEIPLNQLVYTNWYPPSNMQGTLVNSIYLIDHCWYDSVTVIIDMDMNWVPDGLEVRYPDGRVVMHHDSLGGNGQEGYIEFYNDEEQGYSMLPPDFGIGVGQMELDEKFRFYITVEQTEYIIVEFLPSNNTWTNFWAYVHGDFMYYNVAYTIETWDTVIVYSAYDLGDRDIIVGNTPCHNIVHTHYILGPDQDISKVYIPNTFTPNNDGKNDYFKVYDNRVIRYIRMKIYDRWGGLMFDGPQWDGYSDGQACPIGTYTYLITAVDLADRVVVFKGDINLIR